MHSTYMATQLERTRAARERARARWTGEMPRWYSPWGHLACTTGLGIACLVLGAWKLHAVRPLEWLVVPAIWLIANGFEWRVHKDVLHKRMPFPLSNI